MGKGGVECWQAFWSAKKVAGDSALDGAVGVPDLVAVRDNLTDTGQRREVVSGGLNTSGKIDFSDLRDRWQRHLWRGGDFAKEPDRRGRAAFAAVPEPGGWLR